MSKTFLLASLLVGTISFSHAQQANGYAGYFGDQLSSHYFHPEFHWAIDFSKQEATISLEDGSKWRVDNSEFSYLSDWRKNDPLTLNYISLFNYYTIKNHSDRKYSSVQVSFSAGPVNGKFARQIVNIDATNQTITLSDRTRWSIPYFQECNNWVVGDYVIVAKGSVSTFLFNYNLKKETYATLGKWIYGELH